MAQNMTQNKVRRYVSERCSEVEAHGKCLQSKYDRGKDQKKCGSHTRPQSDHKRFVKTTTSYTRQNGQTGFGFNISRQTFHT